jgi:hypothetical protein
MPHCIDTLSVVAHPASNLARRTLLVIGLAACWVPLTAHAQMCKGNINTGCASPGAICKPVTSGQGPTGHCQNGGQPKGEKECNCVGAPAPLPLTGTWIADDFGIYYIRQIGSDVWWVGFSSESPYGTADLHRGLVFTSVFRGTLTGDQLLGNFVDVPKGQMLTSGPLTLKVIDGNSLASQAVPNAYRAKSWQRFSPPALPPPDVFTLFGEVKKNQNAFDDHSLLDDLKPAKGKPVSVLGRITSGGTDPYVVKVAYPPAAGRTYNDFICLDGNNSPPDGDLTFTMHVDRGALDQQLGFWSGDDWETTHQITPTNFQNKLNVSNNLHAEIVMYGGTTECGDGGATYFLAPGWQQQGSLSALFNGVPIAGQVAFNGPPDPADSLSVQLTSVLGVPLSWNGFVRVNGILALDCGHGWQHDCNEDDPTYQNQEIHPVYSVDLIQDFSKPRPFANLTGVWAADDAGTYYVREDGNTIWWLGLSTDEGGSFANVFQGTLQGNQISGSWADVPLGQTSNAGMMTLNVNNGVQSYAINRLYVSGGFGGGNWQKLYDAGGRTIVITLDQAEVASASWPNAAEQLEIQVGSTRVTVKPQNPHIVRLPNGSRLMQAGIPARIRVDAPELGGLHMSAQFAGYRANWSLAEGDFKGGTHAQAMTPPSVPHVGTSPVPGLTIRYHIEPADPSGHDRLPK